MKTTLSFILFSLISIVLSTVNAQKDSLKKVYVLPIREEIAPPVEKIVRDGMREAEEMEASLILIEMDTYGGMVNIADNIRTLFLQSEIPIWVFIENNAASAGAFISISCHKIFMKPGATIGAATVVDGGTGEKVDEKYQSFMRGKMRETAEARGRNPRIAEAMVDGSIVVPNVNDSGKVITFTVNEAVQNGYCDGVYDNIDDLLNQNGWENAIVVYYNESFLSSIIRFFLRPAISGVLVSIIVLGLFIELRSPGVGFPGLASLIAAILYFVPAYLDGLVANWEILILLLGLGLLILEIFIIPGFGIAGVSGAVLIFTGLVLALVNNSPQGGWSFELPDSVALLTASLTVGIAMMGSLILLVAMGQPLMQSAMFRRAAVDKNLDKQKGYVGIEKPENELIGKYGIVLSELRPGGSVKIGDKKYEARSSMGLIPSGTQIIVIEVLDFTLIVEEKPN
jgi:membrane-bound serine protease (ClpP class)